MDRDIVSTGQEKTIVYETRIKGDLFPRFCIYGDGNIAQGNGTVPPTVKTLT